MRHKWLLLTCVGVILVHAAFANNVADSSNEKENEAPANQDEQNSNQSQSSDNENGNEDSQIGNQNLTLNTTDPTTENPSKDSRTPNPAQETKDGAGHPKDDNATTNRPQSNASNGNSPSGRDDGQYGAHIRDPPTKKPSSVCTITTLNYECIFQNIYLNRDESIAFGLSWKNNPQKTVTFANSRLVILPKSLFDAFPQIELLNAEHLQIEEIEQMAFKAASNLKTLYLKKNLISSLTGMKEASSLAHIDLSHNRITHIDYVAFEKNRNLEKLIMSHNQISDLPSFEMLEKLELLDMSNNNLRIIPHNQFSRNNKLNNLGLSSNQLNQFDLYQLDNKPNLSFIDVSNNNLEKLYIPAKVQKLDARNNSIHVISANECKLQKLYLSNNQITDASFLRNCRDLIILDLSQNQLQSFDLKDFLPKLNDLNLTHNQLFEIDLTTKHPHSLQILDLSYNVLSYVPANKLSTLKNVKLNNNKFIDFKFFNLKSITYMKLGDNEWNCATIEQIMQHKKDVVDDNHENCSPPKTRSHNGICCRDYSHAFNDRLKEILQETYGYEQLNKKDLEKCKTFIPNAASIKPDFRKITDGLDSETKYIMQQLQNENREIENINRNIESEKTKHAWLQEEDKKYQSIIEKLRGHYGVTKEGLISSNLTLNRILQYTQERNSLSEDLLARRTQEREQTVDRLSNKNFEKSTLESLNENLKAEHLTLKMKEGNLKKQRQMLEKEFNRNSPSLSVKSG